MIEILLMGKRSNKGREISFIVPGVYTWIVPTAVTSVSLVTIGAGSNATFSRGGAGGGLRYRNNIAVTPGDTVTVVVGASGVSGGDTYVSISGTVVCLGGGALLNAGGSGSTLSSTILGANGGNAGTAPGGTPTTVNTSNSGSFVVPDGVTTMTIVGRGGTGTTSGGSPATYTWDRGYPYNGDSGWQLTHYGSGPTTNGYMQLPASIFVWWSAPTPTALGQTTTSPIFYQDYAAPPETRYHYDTYTAFSIVNTPAVPPTTTTGASTTATVNGTTYTFPGGTGGAASSVTYTNIPVVPGQTLTWTVTSGGNFSYTYTNTPSIYGGGGGATARYLINGGDGSGYITNPDGSYSSTSPSGVSNQGRGGDVESPGEGVGLYGTAITPSGNGYGYGEGTLTANNASINAAGGAVRIIWGVGRTFPNTAG